MRKAPTVRSTGSSRRWQRLHVYYQLNRVEAAERGNKREGGQGKLRPHLRSGEVESTSRGAGASRCLASVRAGFLAELDGKPGAAGVLCVHQGVALFGGSATIPELRHRGLQTALLHERMRYAFEQGCDLAMMVAQPGTESQRNAERKGFRIAYTRTKWHLPSPAL